MISIVSREATTVEDSGRLVSARFISKNGGEFAELYSTGDGNSTNEVTHDRRYGRTLLENIEVVVYRYLCDSNYVLIETSHRAPDGSNIRVSSRKEPI